MSIEERQQKILFLNLPNSSRVQRRYMCSYNTPSMLFPPIELLYLAAIAREWHNIDVKLTDAIAENLNLINIHHIIEGFKPDKIVTITGFEIFEEDILVINRLKDNFPGIEIVLFGHYPTHFPKETLQISKADYILEGEPDINFSNLLDYFTGKITKQEIRGVYYLDNTGELCIYHGQGRIKKPEELPIPAHDLLKINLYNEPFLPKPFALIQSARGCPYACNFCVRSYGSRLALRSPESMMEEIQLLYEIHQIKSLRFIDDTFTATSKRVIKFCKLLIESGIKIKWTCLSRSDTLNEEMIQWMSKAGCKRIYIGIESGSPNILKQIQKDINLNKSTENIALLKKYGIETSAFFMVGYPEETDEDFKMSLDYARQNNFDFIIASRFIPYPGTTFYDKHKESIEFNLFPYKNEFKDKGIVQIGEKREKIFYRNFYFKLNYSRNVIKKFIHYPTETLINTIKAIQFQLPYKRRDRVRNDYI